MKLKNLLFQKGEMKKETTSKQTADIVLQQSKAESSSKEISTIKESTGKSTDVEVYSKPQSDIEKFSRKKINVISTLTNHHFKDMKKNQERVIENELYYGNDTSLVKLTIPILENVFPKLIVPYIATFKVLNRPSVDIPGFNLRIGQIWTQDYGIDITCPDKFNSQSTMIDTIGSEVASFINRIFMIILTEMGKEYNSIITISTKSDYLEDLNNLSNRIESTYFGEETEDREVTYLICNDSDEELLQSTKRYHRISNPEFKNIPFKVGMLLNKYVVFVTSVIDKGKLFMFNSSFRNSFFFGFYELRLICRGDYKATARFLTHKHSPLIDNNLELTYKLIYLH